MVRYGESLEKARRPGWDSAYLDYASLKSLLEDIERLHAVAITTNDDVQTDSTSLVNKTNKQFTRSDTSNNGEDRESEMVALLGSSQRRGHSREASVSIDQNEEDSLLVLDEEALYHESNDLKSSSSPLSDPRKLIQSKAYEATEVFLSTLRKEVEKVSLFALSRQGELADAVGALRFNPHLDGVGGDNLSKSSNLIIRHDSKGNVGGDYGSFHSDATPHSMASSELDDEQMADELWFLLPSTNPGSRATGPSSKGGIVSNSSLLFRESLDTTAPRPLFTGDAVLRTKSSTKGHSMGQTLGNSFEGQDDNKFSPSNDFGADDEVSTNQTQSLDPFTFIGVELLHLLRFICVNAMGVRKILKKYDKIIERYAVDSAKEQYTKLRDDLKNILPFSTSISPDAHLQQLTNSDSIAAITSSLLRASAKTGSVSVASMEKFLIHDEALLRFKCSIDCIDILREYANVVNEPFPAFLSRQAMIVTGYDLGGIEGMKQRALEVLLTFDPDTILLMDKLELLEWQQRCWQYTFTTGGYKMRKTTFDMVEDVVGDSGPTGGPREGKGLVWGGVDGSSMMINMMSTLLYTVNYYIIAPTANRYAIYLGTNGAFGSTLIGASSFAALFAALLYSLWYNKFSFKSALVFSSLCPLVGNLMYSVALSMKSMKIALIGRILVGFGSAEVVNRQLISACVHFNYMTKASAAFVVAGAAGMSVGPLLAALLVTFVSADFEEDFNVPFVGGVAFNHVSSPGFLMAALWYCQLLAVVFVFSEPDRINSSHVSSSPERKGSTKGRGAGDNQSCLSELKEVFVLVFRTPALPVTLFLFGYIEMICEVLISSCAMVSKRYFGWDGSVPGFLIASLGALVLPAHFVVERASRSYEERVIMKNSIIFIILSLFGIINYNTVYVDVLSGSKYVGRGSVDTWHEVKNMSLDDWHTLRNPLTWEHLLNETNKDWHEFQNMTSEEWSSFQNATLEEWQTLREEAKDEWENLSQETKDKYNAFLNATHQDWIEIRQKSEKEWVKIINVTEDEWSKWSNAVSTEWKKLPNQTDEEFQNIVTHAKGAWTNINNTTNDAVSKAGEEYTNVTNVIKQKASAVVDTASDKLKKLHTKSGDEVSNSTENVGTNLETKRNSDVAGDEVSNSTGNVATNVETERSSDVVKVVKKKNATRHKISNQTRDDRFLESEVFDNLFRFIPHSTLLPYDWGYGYYAYLIGISAIFMGVIILEGVDTSLMCKAAPSKLNSTFLNVGLLATLVGTMGRVLGDGMITVNALIGLSQYGKYTDFVNSLFVPMLPITLIGFYLVRRYYISLT